MDDKEQYHTDPASMISASSDDCDQYGNPLPPRFRDLSPGEKVWNIMLFAVFILTLAGMLRIVSWLSLPRFLSGLAVLAAQIAVGWFLMHTKYKGD